MTKLNTSNRIVLHAVQGQKAVSAYFTSNFWHCRADTHWNFELCMKRNVVYCRCSEIEIFDYIFITSKLLAQLSYSGQNKFLFVD